MRIMAMDLGDRRIGIAVSDELGWTAQGLETLVRRNKQYDIQKITELIDQYKPEKIVIGMPKNMNGTIGRQGEKARDFGDVLREIYNGEIIFWDERLTTVSANRTLIEADLSRKKRKTKVDKLAAILILQGYLDYINYQKKE